MNECCASLCLHRSQIDGAKMCLREWVMRDECKFNIDPEQRREEKKYYWKVWERVSIWWDAKRQTEIRVIMNDERTSIFLLLFSLQLRQRSLQDKRHSGERVRFVSQTLFLLSTGESLIVYYYWHQQVLIFIVCVCVTLWTLWLLIWIGAMQSFDIHRGLCNTPYCLFYVPIVSVRSTPSMCPSPWAHCGRLC